LLTIASTPGIVGVGPVRQVGEVDEDRSDDRSRELAEEVDRNVTPVDHIGRREADRDGRVDKRPTEPPDRVDGHRNRERPPGGDDDPAGVLCFRPIEQHSRHHSVSQEDQDRRPDHLGREVVHSPPLSAGRCRDATGIAKKGR
jgi:hypothetical protein